MEEGFISGWGFPGISNWKEAQGKTQDTVVGLCTSPSILGFYLHLRNDMPHWYTSHHLQSL